MKGIDEDKSPQKTANAKAAIFCFRQESGLDLGVRVSVRVKG